MPTVKPSTTVVFDSQHMFDAIEDFRFNNRDEQIYNAIRDRSIAESQPKNISHTAPPAAILRMYCIRRFTVIILTIIDIKRYSFTQ